MGDQIPDYGGADATLTVERIEPPHALVYSSERRGARFSWAILLTETPPRRTLVRLRFRGRIASRGWRARGLTIGGELFDAITAELMLRGLDERVRDAGR